MKKHQFVSLDCSEQPDYTAIKLEIPIREVIEQQTSTSRWVEWLNSRLKESGFDLSRVIHHDVSMETGNHIFTQTIRNPTIKKG